MARSINPSPAPVVIYAGLFVLTALGGCEVVGHGPEPAAAPTTRAPYSSAQLADELEAAIRAVKTAIDNVATAKTYRLLDWELGIARDTIRDQAVAVRSLPGPAAAKAALEELGAGLSDLRLEIDHAIDAVRYRKVCAAPSAMAMIGSSRTRESLQSAVKALAAATDGQFTAVEILPPKVLRQNRSLANGALIRGHLGTGSRYIVIDNRRGTVDLVLTMSRGGKPVYSIYAKRGRTVTARGILNGSYGTHVTLGSDWDRKLRVFTRDCRFLRYSTTTKLGVAPRYYDYWRYWFNVKGRKVTTDHVDPEDSIQP